MNNFEPSYATSDRDRASPFTTCHLLSKCFCDINISGSEVYNILVTLDPTKAMGIDSIGPKLLKHRALALFQLLHHLVSLSLTQHYIPEEWRIHQITPIHKLVDRSLVKKYRLISLLCTVSKVLEKIIYNHIIQFVNNSVSFGQFGFLQNRVVVIE